MRKAGALNLLKKIGWIGIALNLTAFSAPQKDDLLELTGHLYGRKEARFRSVDQNKVLVLKPGTRAVVKEVEHFSGTGNYGLCLEIRNATDISPDAKCVWVYYNVKNPALQLYSGIVDTGVKKQILDAWAKDDKKVTLTKTTAPEKAAAAQTTRAVSGVVEKAVKPAEAATSAGTSVTASTPATKTQSTKGADAGMGQGDLKEFAKANIRAIENFNKNVGSAMAKNEIPLSPACPDGNCNKSVDVSNQCSTGNGYLENPLARLLEPTARHASFFNSRQKEIIADRCIKSTMTLHGSGKRYQCAEVPVKKGSTQTKIVPIPMKARACVSDNKVNIVSKAFNLAADCFGIANKDSENVKQESALAVFSLMVQESGMHMNVVSPSGAAGVGQLTDDAIKAVNENLRSIRGKLSGITENPNCSQVLASVFEKPMSASKLCDRIGIDSDNPLKNIAFSFAYQNIVRGDLDRARFSNRTFEDVLSPQLDPAEASRLKFSLVAWGHNTGPGGLLHPLGFLMRDYVRRGKTVKTAQDVDKFLQQLNLYMKTNPHPRNSHRRGETSNYHKNILAKVGEITKEPKSCLAN